MIFPTSNEIELAYRAIDADGPNSPTTAILAMLCLKTRLNGNAQRIAGALLTMLHVRIRQPAGPPPKLSSRAPSSQA